MPDSGESMEILTPSPSSTLNDPNQPPQFETVAWIDPYKLTRRQFIVSRSIRAVFLFSAFSMAPVVGGILLQVPLWKALIMAGLAGLGVAWTFLAANAAKTGRITRRDIDVALSLAANDLPNHYALQQGYTYQTY